MAQAWAKRFYSSKKWLRCRQSYIKQRYQVDGGMCELCHDAIGIDVDHIEELTPESIKDANISLNHDNLQLLCKECHNKKTHTGVSRGRVLFDNNGDVILIRDKKK